LKDDLARFADMLFETKLDRNDVERALKERPIPENCPLSVDGAEALVAQADDAFKEAKGAVRSALVGVAKLLQQPVLRALLEQGRAEPFIAEILKAADAETLADLLARRVPADPALVKLLAKYLKQIVKKTVLLQDFRPSRAMIEMSDIETIVGEFRKFLEAAGDGDGKSQSIILEIK